MLLSFLSIVFLTRLLGPVGNGVYIFTTAVLNLFMTIIGFQLESTLPVFLAGDKKNTPDIIGTIGILAISSIIAFAVILCVIVFVVPGGAHWVIPEGHSPGFFVVFFLIAFIFRRTSTLMQAIMRGTFRFYYFNIYLLLSQLIPSLVYGSLLLLTASTRFTISLEGCFKIILLLESIIVLTGWLMLRHQQRFTLSFNLRPHLLPIIMFSSKNLLSATGHYLNKRLDVWFVQFYRGSATLGQYGVASQIVNFVSEAMSPFNQVLVPHISAASPLEHRDIVERTARLNISIAFTAAILIASTSWIFIPLFFGHSFKPSVAAAEILAIGIIFVSQRLVFTGYFKAVNQMQFPVRAAWAGVAITVILDIILIPSYGIAGAAWATTIAYGTSSIYLVSMARKRLAFQWSAILWLRKSDIEWLLSKPGKNLPS